ncbi:aldo/keto reductase [Halarcobacter sp.]|uniref:aldo/keto reductase n=1 Tax=Halarcobacter sp. TaxID=2321133 RepID=UPI003A9019AE
MQTIKWKDENLSKLCLGTVQFGLNYGVANTEGQVSLEEATKILDFSISKGINTFDTAKAYGSSEKVLNTYFKERNSINPFIISKISSDLFSLELTKFISDISNFDNLFALLLHDNEKLYSWTKKDTQYIKELKAKNIIKYFGASIYTDEEFNKALENDEIEIIQIPFNIFDQRAISLKWLEKAKKRDKLIFIRSIYLQGLLLMDINKVPVHLADAKEYLEKLINYANILDISVNELCLFFVNQVAKNSILLFGCDNLTQAKENIQLFNLQKTIDAAILENLQREFSNIEEEIYNPTKWNKV